MGTVNRKIADDIVDEKEIKTIAEVVGDKWKES